MIQLTTYLSWNKWHKYQLLIECQELAKFLPKTYKYTKDNFWEIMNQYREVIIKPVIGHGGNGVVKISDINGEKYEIHIENKKIIIEGKSVLNQYLQERQKEGNHPSLVQNCIPLAKVAGNLMEFRFVVQRKQGEKEWVITGKYGKVAQRGYIIVNRQKGADIITAEEALLNSNIKNLDLGRTMADLSNLSLEASKCLSLQFKDSTMWGYDLGVDEFGHVWMIEANGGPNIGLDGFRNLEDLSMYETIKRYQSYNNKKK